MGHCCTGTAGNRSRVGCAVWCVRRYGEMTINAGASAHSSAICRACSLPFFVSSSLARSWHGLPALPVLSPWRTKMARINPLYAARNKRGQKRKETPDSKPWGRWQSDRRRILDRRGQAALLRARPGAFLFDLARLYTQAQRPDQPRHPQQGFCFCTCAGRVREGRALFVVREKAKQRGCFGVLHSFGDAYYEEEYVFNY